MEIFKKFIITVFIFFAVAGQAFADFDVVVTDERVQEQEFGLPPLTSAEREFRLNTLIKPLDFSLYRSRYEEQSHQNERQCWASYEGLISQNRKRMLAPSYVAHSMNDPWVKTLLEKCGGDLSPDKIYEYFPEGVETEKPYLYYLQATANFEFYDLSKILGQGTWGIFGEGATPHDCRTSNYNICQNWRGYKTIGKIFNINECVDYLTLDVASRVRVSGRKKPVPDVAYFKSNNFFSFSMIDGVLHVLSFKTDLLNRDSCMNHSSLCSSAPAEMTPSGTVMNLYEIDQHNKQISNSCVFEVKYVNKGEPK